MARKKKLTKKQKKQRFQIIVGTLIAGVAFLLGLFVGDSDLGIQTVNDRIDQARQWMSDLTDRSQASVESTEEATIHIFDVGQGMAKLFQADGTTILIDTGRFDDSDQRIIQYLDNQIGVGGKIDLLIFSHNDADHIGHGDLVIEYFDVQEVWMNGMDHTTRTYENVLDAILADEEIVYHEPKAGEVEDFGPFLVEVYHPLTDEVQSNHNEESIVQRVTVNDFSLMASGDASYDIEDQIIENFSNLQADILMVGHHGAHNSTGWNWIEAVNPEIAIYQAGENNSYGHPHNEVLHRLEESNIPVYGTPEFGNIEITINEQGEFTVETERGNP